MPAHPGTVRNSFVQELMADLSPEGCLRVRDEGKGVLDIYDYMTDYTKT